VETETSARDATPDPVDASDAAAPVPCSARVPNLLPDDGTCPGGSVTFHLDAPASWLLERSGDSPSPLANWLTIFRTSGEELPFYGGVNESNGGIECTTCLPAYPVAIGASIGPIGDAGATEAWDGLYFQPGQCTSDAGYLLVPPPTPGACVTRGCAPPGTYAAVFCAYPSVDWQPSADASCATVPFEYPSTAAVCGALPAQDRDL
jgi:hypothetical protein